MEQVQATHLLSIHNDLGEGPLWHPIEKRLYWVDIEVGHLHRYNPASGIHKLFEFDTSIGAFGFRQNNGLILATGKGFASWLPGQSDLQILADPIGGKPGVRLNDGKVDSIGRFWAGSHDPSGHGALYRLDPDGSCHTLLNDVTISNGLGWSLDDRVLYYTDSGDYAIYTFDFDPVTGALINRNVFLQLPKDHREGVPDGLTIDSEGYIWSARWDAGKVVRHSPEGTAVLEIHLPVSKVTSVTFGGDDLRDLFITTASTSLSPSQRIKQPLAGDLFVYRSRVSGLPTPFFGAHKIKSASH